MNYEERKGKKRKENQLCFLICLIAFHFSCAFSPVDGNDSWEAFFTIMNYCKNI